MTQIDILNELKKFSTIERLKFVEAALDLIRQDLQEETGLPSNTDFKSKLTMAAKALLPDYTVGGELAAFTVLDSEEVDETR